MRYQNRISGPLLDRIDIHVEVPRVDYEKLSGDRLSESSKKIRERVERAREKQRARFIATNLQCNGDRILKLARTIADLGDCDQIETAHLGEAIQYRPRKQF